MGLFDLPLERLDAFLARHAPREAPLVPVKAWRADAGQVILRDETALELGSPARASVSLLLWEERPERIVEDRLLLLEGEEGPSLPLAQVITVAGSLGDETYERHRLAREAVNGLQLRGVMARVRPSRQRIWYRVHRRALDEGMSTQVLGSALIAALEELPFVDAAQVLLVTAGDAVVQQLQEAADLTHQITGALTAMHEELMLDCEACEFQAICASVDALRELHQRLEGG
jgi:CO dehydrogenase/acetyl-CoA synthase beta subunit